MLVTKQLTLAIDLHSIFFHTMEINSYSQLFGYRNLQNTLFCSQQKKETYTSLERVNEDRIFAFKKKKKKKYQNYAKTLVPPCFYG